MWNVSFGGWSQSTPPPMVRHCLPRDRFRTFNFSNDKADTKPLKYWSPK